VIAEEERLDASELMAARRQTIAGALLGFLSNLGGAVVTTVLYGHSYFSFGNLLRYAHSILCVLIFAAAWFGRPSRRFYLSLFAMLVVPILPLLVVWTLAVPEAKQSESFIAFKMVIMGVSLLVPLSLRLGLALLLAYCVEIVAMWALHISGQLSGEPWVTLFYAVFAALLIFQRDAERHLTRRLVHLNSEAAALDRIARSSLQVRDRMNTPLQTLTLSIELLAQQVSDAAAQETLTRMRRALVRLTDLSLQLAEQEPKEKGD
jgi:hypothetical protein